MDMLVFAGTVEGVTTRKDKTLRITIGTQELTPDKGGELMSLQNDLVYLAIKKSGLNTEEVEMVGNLDKIEKDLYDNKKTQSQRLRSVLYLTWKNVDNKGYEEFKDFYMHETERIIQNYIGKIEETKV